MTSNDYSAFVTVVTRLAEQTRERNISPETVDAYFEVLSSCELCDVEAAAKELGLAEWFPKAGAWRERAKAIAGDRLREEWTHRPVAWQHECARCEDDGWVCSTCGTIDCIAEMPAHERRMRPCACRPNNSTYRRRNSHGAAA